MLCMLPSASCPTPHARRNASSNLLGPELPASLGNASAGLPAIESLDLSRNRFGSSLPAEWGAASRFPSLAALALDSNNITGGRLCAQVRFRRLLPRLPRRSGGHQRGPGCAPGWAAAWGAGATSGLLLGAVLESPPRPRPSRRQPAGRLGRRQGSIPQAVPAVSIRQQPDVRAAPWLGPARRVCVPAVAVSRAPGAPATRAAAGTCAVAPAAPRLSPVGPDCSRSPASVRAASWMATGWAAACPGAGARQGPSPPCSPCEPPRGQGRPGLLAHRADPPGIWWVSAAAASGGPP